MTVNDTKRRFTIVGRKACLQCRRFAPPTTTSIGGPNRVRIANDGCVLGMFCSLFSSIRCFFSVSARQGNDDDILAEYYLPLRYSTIVCI